MRGDHEDAQAQLLPGGCCQLVEAPHCDEPPDMLHCSLRLQLVLSCEGLLVFSGYLYTPKAHGLQQNTSARIVVMLPKGFKQCEDGNYDALVAVVKENYAGITASQMAEDCFNIQKNMTIKGEKKYRRPEKTMGAVLSRSVLSKVHRWKEVTADTPLTRRSRRLARSKFIPDAKKQTMPLTKVSSTVATTSPLRQPHLAK